MVISSPTRVKWAIGIISKQADAPHTDALPMAEHLRTLPLDVADSDSVRKAVDAAGSFVA